jgi:hypothetical protein
MRGAPTTQSLAIEARRFGRWRYAFSATNDVSMDALFEREVQFFVRPSGKLVRCQRAQTNPPSRQVNQSGSHLEENVSEDLQAGNSAEFSKPQIPLPDREFESVPLRQFSLPQSYPLNRACSGIAGGRAALPI